MSTTSPFVEVDRLVKHFAARSGPFASEGAGVVRAVDDVSFTIDRGETLGVVGESGSGKSTLARLVLGLAEPTSGHVRVEDLDVGGLRRRELKALRRRMQVVFQDPYASLDAWMSVFDLVAEPLRIHGRRREAPERVPEILELVGLRPGDADRYPHEFSGGQRQRIGIARALILDPEFVVLDEPVSALDVSIRAQVLNLLSDLQAARALTYLFIAHDLAVVQHIADRVAVMYLGKIVEIAAVADLYARAAHPYTQALLSAVPEPDPVSERARTRIVLRGTPPSPVDPMHGCRFRTRCWKAQALCAEEEPTLIDHGQGHPVACHFPEVA